MALLLTTGDTVFISYILEYTGDTRLNGLHCNYYTKIVGSNTPSDASIKFNTDDFKFLQTQFSGVTSGFIANKFEILTQHVVTGNQPVSTGWKIFDYTPYINNHTVGNLIDPINLCSSRFIITSDIYAAATIYDLNNYLQPSIGFPDEPSTLPDFGDEQPFPGSIKVVRATDMEVLDFLINLPSGNFITTQNPSYTSGDQLMITEAALLNNNKDVMVIAKTPRPIARVGSQVLAVKIDV